MGTPKVAGLLSDSRYFLQLEYTDKIEPDSGKYVSPYDDKPGLVIVNPLQPEFDREVALIHELNHHIEWMWNKPLFISHEALDWHATWLLSLLRNSPRLAQHYYLYHKKRGAYSKKGA